MINRELDNKILILYILSKLPGETDIDSIIDIFSQNDISYFDFAECLSDLIDNGNVSRTEDGIIITEMGLRNAEAVSGELTYTIKKRTDKLITPLVEKIKRQQQIVSEYFCTSEGYKVHLSMGDGQGDLIDMKLLVADETQAKKIKKNFKQSAEKIYKEIVGLMS